MKTKLLLTAIFLLSFLDNAFSQDYHPLLNNSSWIISDWVSCCRPPEIRTIEEGTDTVIGAYTYKAFTDPFPGLDSDFNTIETVYLREDVAQKKIYKIVDGADMVLYDFNLENGETISQYGYTFAATLDEVTVNGGVRKRITLNSVELYYGHVLKQVWIEGVGTVAHPFYPDCNMYNVMSSGGGLRINTKCSFQNGAYIYGNAEYCSSVQLSTTNEDSVNQGIVFSPIPFAAALTINSESLLQNATFKLYNSHGKLVREINNLNGQKITITRESLASGLYLAQLFENNKLIKFSKVMVD